MALKSTIYKAALSVADIDHGYYADHALTIACHPSETEERLMVRVLAFALFADERLSFGKGLSSEDEADLWQKDLTDHIERWIALGQPDEKWLRKASHRSDEVVLITYGRSSIVWWQNNERELRKLDKLRVLHLPEDMSQALAARAQRGMRWQCTIQDGNIWMSDEEGAIEIRLDEWKAVAA